MKSLAKRQVKISEVCEFIRGITFTPFDKVSPSDPGAIACFRTKNVQEKLDPSDLFYLPRTFVSNDRQYIRVGDILISNANSKDIVGKCCFVDVLDFPATLGGFITAIRADKSLISPRYLYFWMSSPLTQTVFRRLARQTTNISNLPMSDVGRLELDLPPLPEQERIVRLLDEAETLRHLRARANERTAELIPAIFHEMFGDPAKNERGWLVAKFGEICECRLGKMLDAKQQTGQHRRLYLRNVNVQWGRFDLSDVLEMDFDEKSREMLRLRAGDLLICEGGEVGRCAIWNDELPECYFQKALHRARPKLEFANSEYILWSLWSLAKSGGLNDFTTQSTIAHLTGVKLNSLPVPLPPLHLQREFAARVAEVRAMEENQAEGKARLDALFDSMLARAFAGEV